MQVLRFGARNVLFLRSRSKTQYLDENGTKRKIFSRVLDMSMRHMRWREASLTDWKWIPGGEMEMQSGNGKFDRRQTAGTEIGRVEKHFRNSMVI